MASKKTPRKPSRRIDPNSLADDRIAAIIKGLISGVPVVGGLIAELFAQIRSEPHEERRAELLAHLAQRLAEIQSEVSDLKRQSPSPGVTGYIELDLSNGLPEILDSQNVTSIDDDGTNDFAVNLATVAETDSLTLIEVGGRQPIEDWQATRSQVNFRLKPSSKPRGRVRLAFEEKLPNKKR